MEDLQSSPQSDAQLPSVIPIKVITKEFARVGLSMLLKTKHLKLRLEPSGSCSLFLGDCPLASYTGPDWSTIYDSVLEDKIKARMAELRSETNP